MSSTHGPMVQRRKLGSELRQLREGAGLTTEDAARELEISQAKISRVELGRVQPRPIDVRAMTALYGAGSETVERLLGLARAGKKRRWWSSYGDIAEDWFRTFVGLEDEATAVHTYEGELIPGLLQTEEYAKAVNAATASPDRAEHIEREVELRLRRQERLQNDPRLHLHAVISEGALLRGPEDAGVMRVQLEHLLTSGKESNITLQVLPFAHGLHEALAGPFVILKFPEAVEDLVYLGNQAGAFYLEDKAEVAQYNLVFDRLTQRALDTEGSRQVIEKLVTQVS